VPGVGGVGAPSLSEVQAWDVTHLENAARDWTAAAEHWESSFTSIHRTSVSPGGTVWEGTAAEAAQERAFADLVKVRGLADVLHESSAIARRGTETLYSAKRSVLDAVDEARAAEYEVGEDLSVTPRRGSLAAQAQAQTYAARIQERAAQLAVHDKEIAARLTSSAAPLNAVSFTETPQTSPHNGIQQADYTVPRPLDPTPWQPPPPGYPQGQPAGPGLPPDGVRPPVDGPVTTGPASKPSVQAKGGQSLFDKNGGEWRYDPGQDRFHYPHWDYNPHTAWNSQWDNVGIDGLPTHREGSAPARSGSIGPPPGAAPAPAPAPAAPAPPPAAEPPPPKAGWGEGFGGGPPIGPHVIPPPHAHQHWLGETPEDEWTDPNH
jgi:hypothetical protein